MYLSANQLNLVSGVITVVEVDTIPAEYVDGIENEVTYRITPEVAGFYSVDGVITLANVIATKDYTGYLYISNVARDINEQHSAINLPVTMKLFMNSVYFSITDYVDLRVKSGAGVDTVDISAGYKTSLTVQRVR